MAEMQRPEAQKPLSEAKKWSYGAGSMISTMTNSLNNTFYYYFLTNVVGMSATLMGLVTSISRVVGLVYGPISGAIMQRAEWKTGKFRTWMMYFYPASIIFFALCYVNVQASEYVQFAYYCGVYIIGSLLGAYQEKAQLSLVPLMAHSQKERLELTSKRSAIATSGTVLYSLITVSLVAKLGGGDQGKGYLYVFIIYAILGIFGYQITSWSAKDYDLYKVAGTTTEKKVEKKKSEYTFGQYVAAFVKNPPVILQFFGDLMKATATMLYTGSISYYFIYNIGNIGKLTVFLLTSNVLMLLGSLCAPILAKKFDKKVCNTIAYTGFAVGLIAAAFVGSGTVWGVTVCIGFGRFCSGLNASLSPAMYADIGDYYENKTGLKMHAYLLTFFSMNFTIAQLFTGIIISACLAAVGYSATADITPAILTMFRNMVSLIPGIPLAVGAVASLFYPLTEKKMDEIHAELAAKRG
jgi:GPH family glycoside/pentoside/hexuronide:cation symporter